MEDMLGMPNPKVEEVRRLLQECHKHSCFPKFSITVFDNDCHQWEDRLNDCCLTNEGLYLDAMYWDGGGYSDSVEIEDSIAISDIIAADNPKQFLAEWLDAFLVALPELKAYLNETART